MVKNEQPTKAVCDAGPIIHLDELSNLQLLADFELWIPPAVKDEIVRHRPTVLDQLSFRFSDHGLKNPSAPTIAAMAKAFSLDRGEAEALSIMSQFADAIFLTDAAAARLVGHQLGYNVHGTIGVLIRAIRRNQRSPQQVLDILKRLPNQSTLFIRRNLLEEIISRLRKEFGLH